MTYTTPNAGTDVTADLEEEGVSCTDCIDLAKLDDDAGSPSAGDFVTVRAGASDVTYTTPNAGTDVTADLEEELQIGGTTIGDNPAVAIEALLSTGANAASWAPIPDCNNTTEKLDWGTNPPTCVADQTGGTVTANHAWNMWEVMPDGTQCGSVSEQTINSGPHVAGIKCADNAASAMYFNLHDGTYGGGTVIFSFAAVNANATPTGVLDFDISCQCRGDSDAMNSTWGTVQNFSITFDTQNDLELASTAAVTPEGSCAANDYLFCRAVMDDTSTTTEVADTVILGISGEEQ
jgi:hypothetical protein